MTLNVDDIVIVEHTHPDGTTDHPAALVAEIIDGEARLIYQTRGVHQQWLPAGTVLLEAYPADDRTAAHTRASVMRRQLSTDACTQQAHMRPSDPARNTLADIIILLETAEDNYRLWLSIGNHPATPPDLQARIDKAVARGAQSTAHHRPAPPTGDHHMTITDTPATRARHATHLTD